MRGKGQDENKYLRHRWSASYARLKLYCLNPIRGETALRKVVYSWLSFSDWEPMKVR
jgi:hypothetical protein